MALPPNFNSLLSAPTDQFQKPKPLPAGTYKGIVKKHEFDQSREKKTPFVRFDIQPTEAMQDVAPDDLAGVELNKKLLRATYYLTPDASYRVVELAKSLGYQTEGRSLGEVILDISSNSEVLLDVTQRTSTDGEEIYNDVQKVKGLT